MRAVDILEKKREGESLTQQEIDWFIVAYTKGDIPDYQASALLMAICINGMSREETVNLTQAMAQSGQLLDLSDIIPYAVDKHSSGGVGDKTTLVVLPLVASLGVPIAKMSGRGLGFTGGTLDKLEAIRGYNVNLSDAEFRSVAKQTGLVLAGQTGELAPADGKLYALRDVTATVQSLPLIASSIMSKKLAAGANGIVLDVKVGSGAFMKSLDEARELAKIMVQIGVDAGRDMVALLSDMNQPLGVAVGNALEVKEAIETLQGEGPTDFREHCLEIGKYMLRLAGQGEKWTDDDDCMEQMDTQLSNGKAFEMFRKMVQAQGGDVSVIDDPTQLPSASIVETYKATQDGYLSKVQADKIGMASLVLGAGREKKEDPVDLAVGLEVHCNVGDDIKAGDTLVTIHANDSSQLESCKAYLKEAFSYSLEKVDELPLFYDVITG